MGTKLLHIERERYSVAPDAWIHVTWFGLAIRLWALTETRYDVCRDAQVTKPWRRFLLVRFKPKFSVEFWVGA